MSEFVVSVSATSDDFDAWSAYVHAHPASTAYHTLGWREIFRKSLGYESFFLIARETRNGTVAGVLPLYLVPTPFSRRLVAVPFRDRGGALWSAPGALDALLTAAKACARETGAKSINLKSLHPYPSELVQRHLLAENYYWVHSSIALFPGRADDLWGRIGDKNRNMVRQAQRNSVSCTAVELTDRNVNLWYEMHVTTQKRLGIPPFPQSFFETMVQQLRATGEIAIFVARQGEIPVAASIILLRNRCAIYGYSASSAIGQRLRANDLMLWTIICRLTDLHYETFDMGSDSPLQENLLFFKRKWLAVQHTIPYYEFGSATGHRLDSSIARYALARKALGCLPVPVLKRIGAVTTRYFG